MMCKVVGSEVEWGCKVGGFMTRSSGVRKAAMNEENFAQVNVKASYE